MAQGLMLEKWSGTVSVVNIGATKEDGGTRSKVIRVGGEATLPFLFQEGAIPNKPVIAFEIWDVAPGDWPPALNKAYAGVLGDPFAWAQECVKKHKAELLCVKLQGGASGFWE
ncbi:MAG: hypothetical protein ABIH75_02090 [Candidatus Omnitrophota bacterium]